MIKGVVFKRIRGRIIPIIQKVVGQRKPRPRQILRDKASARTNLSNKRIGAIKSVREAKKSIPEVKSIMNKHQKMSKAKSHLIDVLNRKLRKIENDNYKWIDTLGGRKKVAQTNLAHIPAYNVMSARRKKLYLSMKNPSNTKSMLGRGAENFVFNANNKAVKVPKSQITSQRGSLQADNLKGGKFSILLAKKKVSPETFVVSTSKDDYIVQDIVRGKGVDLSDSGKNKMTRKLENMLGGSNILVDDLHRKNVLRNGKKKMVIDTGTFDFVEGGFDKHNFSKENLRRLNKFVIKSNKRRK